MAVGASSTKVVQVTNIAPQATKDQMQILFGYLGKIEDIRLYPTIRDVSCPVQARICYIKFVDSTAVGIAQHMTNTVFIDRALIVIPVQSGEIPDEYYALEMTKNGTIVPGLNLNEPKLPPHVVNSVQGTGADQVIMTTDTQFEANALPNYPPLPNTYDSTKVEETRRTVLVVNPDPSITPDDFIDFFSSAGEVKYLRMCKSPDGNSHMLIEFSEQPSIINALKLNGKELKGKPIEIQHATQPIVKPQAKSNEAAQKEIEEAMSRFKEAQNMISASIEPVIGMLTKDKRSSRRSRSRSRERRRKRSRSRSRSKSRKRSRSRRRRSTSSKRSRSRDRKRRSKSRSRKRSKSRSKHRSTSRRRSRSRSKRRSRSRDRKSRGRSRDRRSRDRSKSRRSRDRSRSKERKRSKDRKSRESSRVKEKIRDSKDRRSKESSIDIRRSRSKSRSVSRRRSRSRDRKKDRKRSRSRGSRRRSPTPRSSKRRSRSRSRDKKRDKKDKKRDKSRSRSRDKKEKNKDRSHSRSRSVARKISYDKKSEVEKDKPEESERESSEQPDKDSGEKSDNMDISNSP